MNRSGSFLLLLLGGLGIFAAAFLLFGDSLGGGYGGSGYGSREAAGSAGDLLGAGATLDTKGTRPKTAAEIAAEKAAAEAAARALRKEDGIFGTVTDGRGRPVRGASVTMRADPVELRLRAGAPEGEPIARATTDEQGGYVIGPSPADEYAHLRAEAPGYAASVQRVRRKGARVDFILDRGGSLALRVLDVAGKPVVDAHVQHQAGVVTTQGRTDAEGTLLFASLPTGTGSLLVSKPGHAAVRDPNVAVAPGEREERTLVLPAGLDLTGIVIDGETQQPMAGADVSVRYPHLGVLDDARAASTRTGEDGRFEALAFVSGQERYLVRVTREGYAEARVWRNAQTKGEIEVRLTRPGEAFEGRVVDSDGQPLGGVRITYGFMGWEERASVPEAASQPDGAFVLPLPAFATPGGSFTVVALSDTAGFASVQASMPREKGQRTRPLEIKLGGSGTVTGLVRDVTGQPVQGATVTLLPDWSETRRTARGGQAPWQQINLLNGGEFHNLAAVTGMDGRYRVTGVPALAYRVSASFGLLQVTLPDPVTVGGGDTAQADIALGEGGTIEGWVQDSDGKPIAGAYLSAYPADRRGYAWGRPQPSARSQSDGRFVLRGVGEEAYTLHAYAAGYGNAQQQNVRKGDSQIQLRLKAKGWIEGLVMREGRPYAGMFTVVARPLRPQTSGSSRLVNFEGEMMGWSQGWVSGQQQRTFNTDDGRFRIRGLDAGDYNVQATTRDGLLAVQADVVSVMDGRGSREAVLELHDGAVVAGAVRDDETGRGVPNVWIYAQAKASGGAPAPTGNARSDHEGRYEIRGLGAATYTITAYVGGAAVTEQVDLQIGEQRTLDLVKQPPGTVQVVVVDADGAPVPDARVNLKTASGNWVSVDVGALRRDGLLGERYDWRALYHTGADGVLTRYHVPPGTVTVYANKNGFRTEGQAPEVAVASGRVTQVTLTLVSTAPARPPPPPPAPPGRR